MYLGSLEPAAYAHNESTWQSGCFYLVGPTACLKIIGEHKSDGCMQFKGTYTVMAGLMAPFLSSPIF